MSSDDKYLHKYRIPSNRLPGYDYSSTGLYFVTICTKDREKYFGEIHEGVMILSAIGKIAEEELLKTNTIRPNINIDTWIIMPNHVHLIIGIDNQKIEKQYQQHRRDVARYVSTMPTTLTTSTTMTSTKSQISPKHNSLGAIIRSFKSASTKRINEKFGKQKFAWQSRYHDHVIRNEKSLTKIRQYINDNPTKWAEDEMFKD